MPDIYNYRKQRKNKNTDNKPIVFWSFINLKVKIGFKTKKFVKLLRFINPEKVSKIKKYGSYKSYNRGQNGVNCYFLMQVGSRKN